MQATTTDTRSAQVRKEKALSLLTKLAEAEVSEIETDAKHVAATKNPMVRLFYQYGLEDAKRHLEIFTMIRSWVEQGYSPSLGKIDVGADILNKEANSESGVAAAAKELLAVLDSPDAKGLVELVLGDEQRHENGLRALRERANRES